MGDNLFYEVSNVITKQDVMNAFESAKTQNAKYYRCVKANTNETYGYVAGAAVNIKNIRNRIGVVEMINGVDWFLNPFYKEGKNEQKNVFVEVEEKKEEPIVLTVANEDNVVVSEVKVEAVEDNDYKALFEAQKETLSVKTKEYELAKASLVKAREAQIKTLSKIEEVEETIRNLVEDIEELKDDIASIKYINLE